MNAAAASDERIHNLTRGRRPRSPSKSGMVGDTEYTAHRSENGAGGEFRLRLRPSVFLPLIVFLGLVVHLLLPRITVLDQSLHVLQSLSVGVIGLAILAQATSYVANGALLRAIVTSSRERIPLARAVAIVMAASTVCLVAGGIVGYGAAVFEW